MRKTIFKVFVLILPLFILVSCSSFNSVKELKLSKITFDLEVGQTEKLNLSVEPAKASLPEIAWSSDNEKVAVVDNTGLVKAVSVGKCSVTAKTRNETLSVTSNVTVKPKSVKELKLDKNSVNLEVANSEKLNLTIAPADAAAPEIQWVSSNEKIATVDSNGVIKAVSIGTTTVIAKMKNGVLSATSTITVKAKSVEGIKLNKTSLTLKSGSSEKLQFVLAPADAGNQSVTYSSSNTKIATVDSNGLVKAIAVGTTDISVKSVDGGFIAKCTIKVNPNTTIKINPKTTIIPTKPSTSSVQTNPNMLFKKQAGYMTVTVYEHLGWLAPIGNSSNIEIFIENSSLCIKFNDKGMDFGNGIQWGITKIYGLGTGVTVKLDSTGEILYERKRTAK